MGISVEKLIENMKNHVGKKVKIIGDHPHAGEYGITTRVEIPKGMIKPGMVVKLDNGSECFIFNANELFFIIAQIEL